MPVLLEAGADLTIICAIVMAIATLIMVKYTFEKVAALLDVGIPVVFGTLHPFHGIAVAVRNTVINWCEAAITDLQHALTDLLHGLAWLWREQSKAITWFAHAVEDSLGLLRKAEIPGMIRSATRAIDSTFTGVNSRIDTLVHTVAADVTSLQRQIAAAQTAAIKAAESYAAGLFHSLQTQLTTRFDALEATVAAELGAVPGELQAAEQTVAGRLAAAEATIAGELGTVEDALATVNQRLQAEIDQLASEVGTAGLAAVLTGLLAVVAEAGLDNAACRAKVSGICSTDPAAWADLLAGLAALGFGLSLRELVPVARPLVSVLADAERALA